MQRPDAHKIFIGSLHNSINKPNLLAFFDRVGLSPQEIIVPVARPNKLAIAFATWGSEAETLNAVQVCSGLRDTAVTPVATGLHAHIGIDNGSLFLYISPSCKSCELYDFTEL